MAYVTAPDGTPGTVSDSQLEKALAAGYKVRQPSPKELAKSQAADAPLRAGLEGAGRQLLPVVGPDVIANVTSMATDVSPQQAKYEQDLRREESPNAANLGAGLGFFAGPGKAFGAVKALGPMSLGVKVATGAGSMGTMGLTDYVNETVLKDKPIVAEKALAATAGGMLAGGVTDLGLGVVSKGVSSLIKSFGSDALSGSLASSGNKITGKMLGLKDIAKKYGVPEADILKVAREEGVLHRGAALDSATLDAAKAAEAKAAAAAEQHLQQFSELDAARARGAVPAGEVAAAPEVSAASREGTKAARPRGLEPALAEEGTALGKTRISGQGAPRDSLGTGVIPEQANAPIGPPESPGVISDFNIDIQAPSRLKALSAYREGLENAVARFNTTESPLEGVSPGALIFGGPVAAAKVVAGKVAMHEGAKRGGFLLGETMSKLGESGVLKDVAEGLQARVEQMLQVAPGLLGPFQGALAAASAQGAQTLLETHVDLMNSNAGPEYSRRMGIPPEESGDSALLNKRMAALDAFKRVGMAQDAELESASAGMFGKPGKPSAPTPMTAKSFEKVQANIKSMLKDPESAMMSLHPELQGAAPVTSAMLVAAAVNAARFLDSKLPKNPQAGLPPAVAVPWQPSAADIDKFNRYKEAVDSPAKALKNIAAGYVAPEQVEALKVVYPSIYAELQQKIGEKLATWKKPLSYTQKAGLTALLGPNATSMNPAQYQVLQQAMAGSQGAGPEQAGGAKPDGRQKVSQEDNLTTQAQRLEGR